MNNYISVVFVALISMCAAALVRADEPGEGYIVTPDKVRIFYKIVGTGSETLGMVHGGPGNSLESIRADMEPLAKGRRIIYYDQRGQGRSEVITDVKTLGYESYVAALEAVRQHFKLYKMTLMGNSWGGLLISLYAVAHPDRIERMVLDSPAAPTKGLMDDMADEISRRMAKIYNAKQLERVRITEKPENLLKAKNPVAICREFYPLVLRVYTYSQRFDDIGYKGDLCAGGPESVRQQRSVNYALWQSLGDFDLMPQLAAVKAPVLVIHGAADVIPFTQLGVLGLRLPQRPPASDPKSRPHRTGRSTRSILPRDRNIPKRHLPRRREEG